MTLPRASSDALSLVAHLELVTAARKPLNLRSLQPANAIEIDLGNLRYLDSSGINVFLDANAASRVAVDASRWSSLDLDRRAGPPDPPILSSSLR